MGIFSAIKDFIFGKQRDQPIPPAVQTTAPVAPPTAIAPATTMATPAAVTMEKVDVAAVLDRELAETGQTLNWRQSIVDLMKLCGMDSSLHHRQELAKELGYDGDMDDSAAMNVWLHKAVMRKLAENGGQVPAGLQA
ncbi:MAG TPA: DUF3597 domain-containing protein [Asticcacaulis sp.]|nr:DUF3597 domain-containing protein [Asticcacaulis sp.]